jgi:hypothetical protein
MKFSELSVVNEFIYELATKPESDGHHYSIGFFDKSILEMDTDQIKEIIDKCPWDSQYYSEYEIRKVELNKFSLVDDREVVKSFYIGTFDEDFCAVTFEKINKAGESK